MPPGSDRPVLVTGATGEVGGRVARALAGSGVATRLFVRSAERAPALAGSAIVQGTYADPATCDAALAGVDTVFMVSATESPDRLREHQNFVHAAAAAGVQHVVYTSFAGASPTATFTFARDHFATEQLIRRSGMKFTFLRDNFYLDVLVHWVGQDGVIRGPAGEGAVAAVARDDVAAVATTVLRAPEASTDATYTLTGPEALRLAQVAETIGGVTGRATGYHPQTVPEAYESRASYNAPQWQLDAWVSTYTAIAAGELDQVSPDVERLLGRPATSLEQLLRGPHRPGARLR